MTELNDVLDAFGLKSSTAERLRGGLINDTFAVGPNHVLQRLHPIFRAEVNLDIAALVPVLAKAGVPVPSVVPTTKGALWVEVTEGPPHIKGVWRMLTRLPGRTIHRVERPAQAFEAGAMVARFHGALLGSRHRFRFERPGVHDTPSHMKILTRALAENPSHRLYKDVALLASDLLARWAQWSAEGLVALPFRASPVSGDKTACPLTGGGPFRIVHGDLKISNFLWDDADRVSGVLDLDTMAWGSLDIELGDALRSWCASGPESAASVTFIPEVFTEAVRGYWSVAGAWMTAPELLSLPRATERLCLELSARFAADALYESYFGWDPQVAPTRGEHNLLRAHNQHQLAAQVQAQSGALDPWLRDLINQSP